MNNEKFYSLARRYQGRINPYAVLCQCNWETRAAGQPWQSELFLRANNAAGLKKWAGWAGDIYEKISWEQNPDGKKVDRKSAFCKYRSVEEFLTNYVKKIESDYPVCTERSDNFWGYFAGLFKGKWGSWATDQAYFAKLCNVAIQLAPEIFGNGQMWRNKLLDSLEYAVQNDYLTDFQAQTAINLIREKVTQIDFNKDFAPSVKEYIICLDPGHGGHDSGANPEGIEEKDYTLPITQTLGKELVRRGFDVRYTRVTDIYISRSERARIANSVNADLFLSIHLNSFIKTSVQGHESWIASKASEKSLKLANLINKHWPLQLPQTIQRGIKRKDFDVLVLTKMPAVLEEIGFLSNPDERRQLMNSAYHQIYASIIANAVEDLFRG